VRLACDLREGGTRRDLFAIANGELCAHRHDELAQLLTGLLLLVNLDHRVELLRPILDDHELTPAGGLVELFPNRLFVDDVDEADDAAEVGDDRLGVRIPAEEQVPDLDLVAIVDGDSGAVGHGETGANHALADPHEDLTLARGDYPRAFRSLDGGDALELGDTLHLAATLRLSRDARRGATDVEGPQRELRTGLADRLRGENSHRLTDIDEAHGGEVTAIALLAEASPALAGQHRPHLHGRNTAVFDHVGGVLIDELAGLDHELAIDRIDDVIESHQTDDPVLERLDDVLTLLEGAHFQPEHGSAIRLRDGDVLRDVDEPAGEIAGVRRLERGVGKALPGAVRRDEVLEHREAFAEVRLDRALDDLTDATGELLLRLPHQPPQAGQLSHLVAGPAGA